MNGGPGLSNGSRVFTRGRGTEELTSPERFLERAARELRPRQVAVAPHHGLTTSGAFVTDTGEGELPAWLDAAWSPVDEALAHGVRTKTARRELTARLHARVGELKRLGMEEGLPWSAASEDDFWAFVSLWPTLREPGLILMDNGDLRAVWRNAAGEQVALEFRGYRQVYFVFFARRPEGPAMARSAGEDSVAQIGEKIAGDNLTELLRGER
jgi:hypothetical protein